MADIISKDNVRTVRYAHTSRKKERKSGVPKVEIQGATYVFDATSRVKNLNPLVRIEVARGGVTGAYLKYVVAGIFDKREDARRALRLPRIKGSRGTSVQVFTAADSERVLGLKEIIEEVEDIVRESGTGESFDARHWLKEWMGRPQAALGGHRPDELLDTSEGLQLVRNTIRQMQSGAYA